MAERHGLSKVRSKSHIACCGALMYPGGVYHITNKEADLLMAQGHVDVISRNITGMMGPVGESRKLGGTMTTTGVIDQETATATRTRTKVK